MDFCSYLCSNCISLRIFRFDRGSMPQPAPGKCLRVVAWPPGKCRPGRNFGPNSAETFRSRSQNGRPGCGGLGASIWLTRLFNPLQCCWQGELCTRLSKTSGKGCFALPMPQCLSRESLKVRVPAVGTYDVGHRNAALGRLNVWSSAADD
jgi:hypothetical protein